MMFGLMRVRTHDAEMAKKDGLIESLDKTAAFYKNKAEAWQQVAADIQARLDALTPARGQGGRFAKREAV